MSSVWITQERLNTNTSIVANIDVLENYTSPETLPSITKKCSSRHPSCYPRHTNLLQPLTLTEKLNLARLHYFTIPNTLRSISVTFCIFWFIYVATFTMKDYLHHDTIVFLSYETANTSTPPAISICTHNLLSGFSAKTMQNLSAWSVLTEDDVLKKYRFSKNLKVSCYLLPDTMRTDYIEHFYKCEDLVPVVISMQEGHRCFTYFSDIYGQATRNVKTKLGLTLKFDRRPQIQLMINGDYMFGVAVSQKILSQNNSQNEPTTTFSGVHFALHDPTILPDMLGLGFHQLKPQHIHSFPFNKRVQVLIEPPYNDCYTYSSFKTNFSKGVFSLKKYRTRGECFLHCQWKTLNKRQPCANYYSIYTKEMVQRENSNKLSKKLQGLVKNSHVISNSTVEFDADSSIKVCPWNKNAYYDYAHSKQMCLKKCPLSCTEITFDETHIEEIKNEGSFAVAAVTWTPFPILHIENKKKWDGFVEFGGVLGGQLHIWLGFSTITALCWLIAAIKLRTNSNF